jgi:hypothetical protein
VTAPSPSPSQSLSPDQAAALAALDGYQATKDKLFADPAKYSTHEVNAMLAQYAGYYMVEGNASALASLKKAGRSWAGGSPQRVWVKVSDMVDNHNARGLEVHITVCLDSSNFRVVDKAGAVVYTPSTPFAVRQYSVRKPAKAWRVFGETGSSGECHR